MKKPELVDKYKGIPNIDTMSASMVFKMIFY